jgi:hypothetical protein
MRLALVLSREFSCPATVSLDCALAHTCPLTPVFAIGALAHNGVDHSKENATANGTHSDHGAGGSAAAPSAPAATPTSAAERVAAGGVVALVVAAVGMAL